MELRKEYGSYINGKIVHGPHHFLCVNPASGKAVAEAYGADDIIIDQAVDAARNAFQTFRKTSRTERANLLRAMADRMEQNTEHLAKAECIDTGKPFGEACGHVGACVQMYRYFASVIEAREESSICHDNGSISCIVREPLGVAGLIVAWNCPPLLLSWKLAPALAMGNTVVIKPSAVAIMGIMEAIRIWDGILPPGVVNVVLGTGGEIGDYIIAHPGIDKLSFTGSVEVGRKVGAAAGKRIIPATLELGGKSASVIFEDANLERALQKTVTGILSSAGEVCVANARILVQETVYDKFLGMLKEKFEGAVIGDPMDPKTQIGPVTTEAHMKKVLKYIQIGQEEGATLVCGGSRYTENGCADGYYIQPTLFGDVKNTMTIAKEEIFGPVLCVMKFKDEADALRQANDSEYGLGAAVWTENIHRALRVSRELQAGTVWINDYLDCAAGNPFGGYKTSGIGREVNQIALDYYSQVKNISISTDESVPAVW